MAMRISIIASREATRQHMEMVLRASTAAAAAGGSLPLPVPLGGLEALLRPLQAQAPEAVLVALPESDDGAAAALTLVQALRAEMPLTALMVVGPMDPPQLIVEAMRAGASEYLEAPLRPAALAEALNRSRIRQRAETRSPRGQLFTVLGARGGSGATLLAVNLAIALQTRRPAQEDAVTLLDAAPLGHAALQLNLKPKFTLIDLLNQAQRLDAAMLASFTLVHGSGLKLIAGPSEPLPPLSDSAHAAWIDLLLQSNPIVVADLSARADALTARLLEAAHRILVVAQTDMVSLWSAATVRQFLDPMRRLRFELVLNRFDAGPAVEINELERITGMPVLWKLPNDHALVQEAIERGQPPIPASDAELTRSISGLAAALLGRPDKKPVRGWLPFLRARENRI